MAPGILRSVLISILRITLGIYGALVLLVLFMKFSGRVERMFFHPDSRVYGTPADLGLAYEDVRFASRDGTELTGWFVSAASDAKGTVIHFHGNAQNMTAHFSFVNWLPRRGFNVFVFDYRGYGASAGRPDRRGVYEDALAAIEYVLSRPDVDRSRVAAYGQSLGGAMMLAVLGNEGTRGIRAVAADSAYESHSSIARDAIGGMRFLSPFRNPLSRFLVPPGLDAGDVVARISPTPLLIMHGTADRVIPVAHARRLYDRAAEPKTLWLVPDRDHTEAITDPFGPWRDRLVDFFQTGFEAPRSAGLDTASD